MTKMSQIANISKEASMAAGKADPDRKELDVVSCSMFFLGHELTNDKFQHLKEQSPQTIRAIKEDKEALTPESPSSDSQFHVENNKFAFSPGQLSRLLNPKSLAAFWALGGLVGIEKGLRTNRKSGLSLDETAIDGTITFEEATNGHASTSSNDVVYADGKAHLIPAASMARAESFADRKRIFKDNRLPTKKAKSIWELAWIAYNDKVLILLTVAAVVSLALGLFQTFGQKHENGEAKVEWVEGVAIVAAM